MNAVVILHWASLFALGCFVLALGCAALRLLRGPTPQDRVLALDAMYINALLILLVLGIRFSSSAYFDIALLIGLAGFAGSTALAKFLLKGEVVQP